MHTLFKYSLVASIALALLSWFSPVAEAVQQPATPVQSVKIDAPAGFFNGGTYNLTGSGGGTLTITKCNKNNKATEFTIQGEKYKWTGSKYESTTTTFPCSYTFYRKKPSGYSYVKVCEGITQNSVWKGCATANF